jgi:hypothetical protein
MGMAALDTNGLWQALQAMRVEAEGAPLGFTAKLAQKTGWSRAYAERVAAEYRRFLYLAATASNAVTPSEAVDEAWHLHLTYTRHYWDELCARILCRPLHHDPGDGGAGDAERHRLQYRETLRLYAATFGEAPPPDIWPSAAAQAPAPLRHVRAVAGAGAGALLLAACTALAANASGGGAGWVPWAIGGVFLTLLVVGILSPRNKKRGRRGHGDCGGGADCGGSDSSDSSDGGSSCGGGGCGGGGGGD